MLELTRERTLEFQNRLRDAGLDVALIADEDSIAYLSGFWGYLGVEFGRPTILLVPSDGAPTVVTPLMESELVSAMTWIEDVRPWQDAGPDTWHKVLADALGPANGLVLGVEPDRLPPLVARFLSDACPEARLRDVSRPLAEMRLIKSPEELDIMRQAGRIAVAMVEAGKAALGEGVPEYETALAVIDGGSRKAAEFLTEKGWEAFVSPLMHNTQIMQSGPHTAMVHRRAGVRRLRRGDPVYFCFCNMVNFKQYKLGFDRQFFIGEVSEERARVYETTVRAQRAALDAVRPGAAAEDVHFAAEAVYRAAGWAPGYRTGRAIGMSYLEAPELKAGDKTVLREGMTFAVDGGITVPGQFGARVGDSIAVTKDGFEVLTPYPKDLCIV